MHWVVECFVLDTHHTPAGVECGRTRIDADSNATTNPM
jgi:hypothetical protein